MPSLVVYTVIFDNYDKLNPVNIDSDCKFICFTDNPNLDVKGWEIRLVTNTSFKGYILCRRIKILPHLYLEGFTMSLYIDGNISIKRDPAELFKKYLNKENFIAITEHPFRNCVFEEGAALLQSYRFNSEDKVKLIQQLRCYEDKGMPYNFGLTENNVIFIDLKNSRSKIFCSMWWDCYLNGFKRDQISLPYILWKNNIKVALVKEGPRNSSRFFQINLHLVNSTNNKIINFFRIVQIRKNQSFFYRIIYLIFFLIKNYSSSIFLKLPLRKR